MRILPGDLRSKHVYQLMVSGIVPRPIAWTGTRSVEGVDNLAPFSYFMGVSSAPPAIAISVVRHPDGSLKDTARNILDTGVFTVSLPALDQGPEMVGSASRLPPDVSELDALGIPAVEGDVVAAPRPAGAPFSMECRLQQTLEVGHATLIIGEVVCFHVSDSARGEGRDGNPVVDTANMHAIGRLGGPHYVAVEELVRISPKAPSSGPAPSPDLAPASERTP
jgi:flavin reductase (DIM6/NTAB) family NADH-FMN oxidoreductase RutF